MFCQGWLGGLGSGGGPGHGLRGYLSYFYIFCLIFFWRYYFIAINLDGFQLSKNCSVSTASFLPLLHLLECSARLWVYYGFCSDCLSSVGCAGLAWQSRFVNVRSIGRL